MGVGQQGVGQHGGGAAWGGAAWGWVGWRWGEVGEVGWRWGRVEVGWGRMELGRVEVGWEWGCVVGAADGSMLWLKWSIPLQLKSQPSQLLSIPGSSRFPL